MDKITGIYRIISPNGKMYIGQSIDIRKRWAHHRKFAGRGHPKLFDSFLEYGVENHTFDIIQTCDREMLDELERYYISLYDSFDSENGLNLRSGGIIGTKFADSSKKLISQKMTGIKRSQEFKDRCRNRMIGNKHSDETKRKMSVSSKGLNTWSIGKSLSEETKRKISEFHLGKYFGTKEKAVMQLTMRGCPIRIYQSQRQAGRLTGISSKKINHNILGNTKSAGGFKWENF